MEKKDKEKKLEELLIKLLRKKELSLVTAESCTGGMLTSRLVSVPGASEVLKAGLVTYSNKAKRKYLDVKKDTLKKYGAVSKQTVKEMAKGAAIGNDSDIAVSITGIAGPDGGTEEKPVGLVSIGCYAKDHVTIKEYKFKGSRQEIREAATQAAMELMYTCVLDNYGKIK